MISWALIAVVVIAVNCIESSVASKYPYNATQTVDSQTFNSPYPYEFPLLQNGSRGDSGQFPMPKCYGFQLEEATIDQVQHTMSKGMLTSVQIVSCYLKRIQQVDEYIRYAT
jgi:amidase